MADERAVQAVEHLQTAALELIAAARAFLDLAEDVVADPDGLTTTLTSWATLLDAARRGPGAGGPRSGDEPAGGGAAGDEHGAPRLRRIDLS